MLDAVAAAEPGRVSDEEQPPYGIIARSLLDGEMVPFLGAGASVMESENSDCPPTGPKLAELLAQVLCLPQGYDFPRELPLMASYFVQVKADREALCGTLGDVFEPKFKPNDLHRLLADVARRRNLLVITTNYDDMMERAFREAEVPFHLAVTAIDDVERAGTVKYKPPGRHDGDFDDVEPSKLDVSLERASIIYKMHGSIGRPDTNLSFYVITEEDYIKFLGRMNIVPANIVRSLTCRKNKIKRFLFLGYSLSDWNFRVMLDRLWSVGRGRELLHCYAIQRQPKTIEKTIWGTKRVTIYDLDLRIFASRLREQVLMRY